MKLKKIFCILLAAVLMISAVSACGGSDANTPSQKETEKESPAAPASNEETEKQAPSEEQNTEPQEEDTTQSEEPEPAGRRLPGAPV